MGFIRNILNRWFGHSPTVRDLPSGSVTVDQEGSIITSTVSSAFPQSTLRQVGQDVVALFREARAAQMPLAEVSLPIWQPADHRPRIARRRRDLFCFLKTALMPSLNETRL